MIPLLQILVVSIVALAVLGGVVTLFIFLLPFILGLVGVGIIAAIIIFVSYIIFQVVKDPVSKEEKPEDYVDKQESEGVADDNESIQLDDEIDISIDDNEYLEEERQ